MKGVIKMLKKYFSNMRKPEGLGGKIAIRMMNLGHSSISKWGFSHINPSTDCKALDIGCGGGANIAVLLSKCSRGTVDGIDYSELSVKESKEKNKKAVENGRCKIVHGDVSKLPYQNESFNLVTAFETVYFWPDIENSFREVRRVIKPGGSFLICNEVGGNNETYEKWVHIIEGMKIYEEKDLKDMLFNSGFSNVKSFRDEKRDWLCIIAENNRVE